MKIMIASDIHGAAGYCEKLMKLFEKEKCEQLFLLGDLLYHGPRNRLPDGHDPKDVVTMLNEKAELITAVCGNCDAEVDEFLLDFPLYYEYVMMNVDGQDWFLTHGHIWDIHRVPPKGSCQVMLYGHIHMPVDEYVGDLHVLNPGSVGLPRGGSDHSCIIYENGKFRFINLN